MIPWCFVPSRLMHSQSYTLRVTVGAAQCNTDNHGSCSNSSIRVFQSTHLALTAQVRCIFFPKTWFPCHRHSGLGMLLVCIDLTRLRILTHHHPRPSSFITPINRHAFNMASAVDGDGTGFGSGQSRYVFCHAPRYGGTRPKMDGNTNNGE